MKQRTIPAEYGWMRFHPDYTLGDRDIPVYAGRIQTEKDLPHPSAWHFPTAGKQRVKGTYVGDASERLSL